MNRHIDTYNDQLNELANKTVDLFDQFSDEELLKSYRVKKEILSQTLIDNLSKEIKDIEEIKLIITKNVVDIDDTTLLLRISTKRQEQFQSDVNPFQFVTKETMISYFKLFVVVEVIFNLVALIIIIIILLNAF